MTAAWLSAFLFSGYVKELWRDSRSDLNTFRARATVDFKASAARAHLEYDNEVLSGDSRSLRLAETQRPPYWLDMELVNGHPSATASWKQRVWRGWGGVETDQGTLRAGRQRVAWGTAKLWNPTDVLNPYDPVSIEREERPGVDSAYGRWSLGDLSQLEAAYAPHDDWERTALLGRARSNRWDYDFSLMGGKAAFSTGTWIVGGDFAGNLGEGSLHGEWAYADPHFRGALGYERTWGDYSLLAEYLYNAAGKRVVGLALPTARQPLLGRHYLGGSLGWEAHALLKLEVYGLGNAQDGSHLISPSATWNALEDLHLTAGWQLFQGRADTEYGRISDVLYLQAQYYF